MMARRANGAKRVVQLASQHRIGGGQRRPHATHCGVVAVLAHGGVRIDVSQCTPPLSGFVLNLPVQIAHRFNQPGRMRQQHILFAGQRGFVFDQALIDPGGQQAIPDR